MARPLVTAEAGRPSPLMAAARASSAGGEGVPDHAAPIERRLRTIDAFAAPAARRQGPPSADRASDAAQFLLVLPQDVLDDLAGSLVVLEQLILHELTTPRFFRACARPTSSCFVGPARQSSSTDRAELPSVPLSTTSTAARPQGTVWSRPAEGTSVR